MLQVEERQLIPARLLVNSCGLGRRECASEQPKLLPDIARSDRWADNSWVRFSTYYPISRNVWQHWHRKR